jgi:hypothetical protein
VHDDVKVGCDLGQSEADVGLGAEVQRPAEGEPSREGFGDEQAASAVARDADRGCLGCRRCVARR